jgi:hypothetical protein
VSLGSQGIELLKDYHIVGILMLIFSYSHEVDDCGEWLREILGTVHSSDRSNTAFNRSLSFLSLH